MPHPRCKIPLCPEKTDVCHCACELRNFLWQKVVGPHSGYWLFLGGECGRWRPGGVPLYLYVVLVVLSTRCHPIPSHLGWISDSGGPIKSPPATVTGSQVESCKAKQLSHHEDVSFLLRIQFQEQEVNVEMERELASPGSTFAPSHEPYLTSLSKKSWIQAMFLEVVIN